MKYGLGALMLAHGCIHLLGFLKAYKLANAGQLTQSISRPIGALWLIAALLILSSLVCLFIPVAWWWLPAAAGVLMSQVLIVTAWQDAKFGTIANAVLLLAAAIGFASWLFDHQTEQAVQAVKSQIEFAKPAAITEDRLQPLPAPVRKWLTGIGIVGKPDMQLVHLKQLGLMRLKPDQRKWYEATAEQYVATDNPSFEWNVSMKLLPFVEVKGRDVFADGKASMIMKLASLVTVAGERENPKVDQSSLQRYLLELPWYPTAALSRYIEWEGLDDHSAKATLTYQGVTGTAAYSFNDNGDLVRVSAFRYKDSGADAKPIECIGEIKAMGSVDGIRVPTKIDVSWMLEDGKFTWFKIDVDEISFT